MKRSKKIVKVFVVTLVMYAIILNAAVFQIMNLNIIFLMKRLFGTVKYFQNYSNSDKRWFYCSCNLANFDFAWLNSAEILKVSGSNQRRTNKNLTEGISFCSVCKKRNRHIEPSEKCIQCNNLNHKKYAKFVKMS